MTEPVAAVTGATGFVGRRLVPALMAAGWSVRVLARAAPRSGVWEDATPVVIIGDLADARALRDLVSGCAVVIHLAGAIKAKDRATFFTVNETGSQALARATRADQHLIALSSLVAREPELSDYAASKRAGEKALIAAKTANLSILRPPAVYGPGDRETLALFRLVTWSPFLPILADRSARLALAHVDDVVAAILAVVEGGPIGGPFAIGGDNPAGYSWRQLMVSAAKAVGAKRGKIPVPAALLRAAGRSSEFLAGLTGKPAIFTAGKVAEILHADWSVLPSELAPHAPPAQFTLDQGFADTVAWYRTQRWLR